jgi:hypothetical protein
MGFANKHRITVPGIDKISDVPEQSRRLPEKNVGTIARAACGG